MNEITQKRRAPAILTAALLMLLAALPLAASAATEVTVTVLVPQTFTVSAGNPDGTFTYRLTPVNKSYPNAPLPAGPGVVTNGAYEYTVTGNETAELGIAFTAPGAYYYRLSCATPDRPGYTLDKRAYRIEITVAANMSAVTVAYDEADRKDKANPAFGHSFTPTGGGGNDGGGGGGGSDIPEEDVPLAEPEDEETIEDEEIPLADMPLIDDLPQTGQLRWPVPVLVFSGAMLFVTGLIRNRGRAREER
jgi:hypothetical protein